MDLILCQIWIKTYFVKYRFYIKLNLNSTVHVIYGKFKLLELFLLIFLWFYFCNNMLIVFFKKRPTLGLYSKAFMNYKNVNLKF